MIRVEFTDEWLTTTQHSPATLAISKAMNKTTEWIMGGYGLGYILPLKLTGSLEEVLLSDPLVKSFEEAV